MQRFVDALRVQDQANGQQMEHLIGLLVDLIVLVRTSVVQLRSALDVQQNGGESPDGIGIATHHHIGETDVVRGRDLARRNVRETSLLVHFNGLKNLQIRKRLNKYSEQKYGKTSYLNSWIVISQQSMDSQ